MASCPFNVLITSRSGKDFSDCTKKLDVAHDILDVLGGKWKMEVILCLLQHEKRRFKEIQKDIDGISSRLLSSVLKDLELNHIVTRNVFDTAPVTVEYGLTEYGRSMKQVIVEFIKLGANHRNQLMGD